MEESVLKWSKANTENPMQLIPHTKTVKSEQEKDLVSRELPVRAKSMAKKLESGQTKLLTNKEKPKVVWSKTDTEGSSRHVLSTKRLEPRHPRLCAKRDDPKEAKSKVNELASK